MSFAFSAVTARAGLPVRISASLLSALLVTGFAATAFAQGPQKAPPAGPVKPAAIPDFQEAVLPNGLKILLVESKRQPVLSLALMMPAGDSHDPAGKEGLATMVASVVTKGSEARSAEAVSAAIEGIGGAIGAGSGADFLTVRASVLSDNAPLAFELVAESVTKPAFATKEVELARTQFLSSIQFQLSQPASLASQFFAERLYGSHPYGRHATPTSVRAITVDDLRAFQRARLVPSGALLVVAGDISLAKTRELASQYFAPWSGRAPALAKRVMPPARAKTEILLVHRPGSVQSNILVGNLTYAPTDPSYYALTVSNRALGGGTDGRLFKILREQKSWTYGGSSSLTRNKDIGTFEAAAEVRNAVTDSALTELLSIERSFGAAAIPAGEFDAAKSGLVGSLPLQLETAQGIAEQVGRYTMLGLPKDFIRTLRPRLAAVTAAQAKTASKAFIRPDQSLVVVVGDGAQIYDKLAKIAPTRIVNAQGDAMTPADLVQKATALPVDISKIVARADSFSILVQGQPVGYLTSSTRKTAEGFEYREASQLGAALNQSLTVRFGGDLKPISVKGEGRIQAQPFVTDVTYANGRAKGTGASPGPTGITKVAIDTAVAPATLDENMIAPLVPGLTWSPATKYSVPTFDASSGTSRQLNIAVTGTEAVTVPAGSFQTYRVEITGAPQGKVMFITTTAPYRIVKYGIIGAPVDIVLVR